MARPVTRDFPAINLPEANRSGVYKASYFPHKSRGFKNETYGMAASGFISSFLRIDGKCLTITVKLLA